MSEEKIRSVRFEQVLPETKEVFQASRAILGNLNEMVSMLASIAVRNYVILMDRPVPLSDIASVFDIDLSNTVELIRMTDLTIDFILTGDGDEEIVRATQSTMVRWEKPVDERLPDGS